jgi:hypothetical protein
MTIAEFEAALSHAGVKVEWRESRFGGCIGLHVARRVNLTYAQISGLAGRLTFRLDQAVR